MRVGVYGQGCVGAVTAACLAMRGHDVVAVDPYRARDAAVLEPGLTALTAEARASGRLRSATDVATTVAATEISLVCVGTPAAADGGFDESQIAAACESIGAGLARHEGDHLVAVRSTVIPRTTHDMIVPILERCAGRRRGDRWSICVNPEFLREGTAIGDFSAPAKTVVGELDARDGDRILALMAPPADTPVIRVDFETAELLKYADNAWHALKVGFANEIGVLAAVQGIDGLRLMEAFVRDVRLNISAAYLRPGAPYGGSCLSKDLHALRALARRHAVPTPILDAVEQSNAAMLTHILERLDDGAGRRYGIVGLGFKPGTGDVRGSPFVALGEALLGRGHAVQYFDRSLNHDSSAPTLPQANSLPALLAFADTIVLCHRDASYERELAEHLTPRHRVLDLGGSCRQACAQADYAGIAW